MLSHQNRKQSSLPHAKYYDHESCTWFARSVANHIQAEARNLHLKDMHMHLHIHMQFQIEKRKFHSSYRVPNINPGTRIFHLRFIYFAHPPPFSHFEHTAIAHTWEAIKCINMEFRLPVKHFEAGTARFILRSSHSAHPRFCFRQPPQSSRGFSYSLTASFTHTSEDVYSIHIQICAYNLD